MHEQHDLDSLPLSSEDKETLRRIAGYWAGHPSPVLFVGAGLTAFNTHSKPGKSAEALTWNRLAERWSSDLKRSGVERLPADPLRLAQLYERAFERTRLLDTLEEAVPEHDLDTNDAFREIAGITWGAVVTTNYDRLLERVFSSTQNGFVRVVEDCDITRRRSKHQILLIKMHGDFDHRKLIVISEDDYHSYRASRPAIAAKVEQLLLEHPLLFVGFSLDDPNVSRILNWVRGTVGTLQMPAASIVHNTPSRAESEMWAARGVRLVDCPAGLPLWKIMRALDVAGKGTDESSVAASVARLVEPIQELVARRAVGWDLRLANAIATGIKDPVSKRDLVRMVSRMRASWDMVLVHLTQEEITSWMLTLYEIGERSFWFDRDREPTSAFTLLSHRVVVPIAEGLIAFGCLSETDRARLEADRALERSAFAGHSELRDKLSHLKQLYAEASDDSARQILHNSIREMLFFLGDQEGLQREIGAQTEEGPSALCLRASDHLLLGEIDTATALYARARDQAESGDETYAALFGLWECDNWSSKILDAREAVPKAQRPKSVELWDLQRDAAEKGFERHEDALPFLERFIRAARRAGWPHASRLRHTGPIESVGKRLARIYFESKEPEKVRAGIGWLLRLGAFDEKTLSDENIGVLGSTESTKSFIREWLATKFVSPRHRQSQAIFALRLLDLMDDATIREVVTRFILRPSNGPVLDSEQLDRWEALANRAQRLPFDVCVELAKILPKILQAGGSRSARCMKVIEPALWPKELVRGNREIARLVTALVACCVPARVGDYVFRRDLFDALKTLAAADLLTENHRQVIERRLLPWMRGLTVTANNLGTDLLEALTLLTDLGADKRALATEFSKKLVGAFGRLKNSSVLGLWCWCVGELGPYSSSNIRAGFRRDLLEATQIALGHDDNDIFQGWARDTAVAIAKNGLRAGVDDVAKFAQSLLKLGERYVEVLPSLPAMRAASTDVGKAKELLWRHVLDPDERKSVPNVARAVADWCHESSDIDARMWEVLGASLNWLPEKTLRARRALSSLSTTIAAPAGFREHFAELVLRGTDESASWHLRAQNAAMLKAVARGTKLERQAALRLEALRKDEIALVRRAAEYGLSLPLARSARPKKGGGRRPTVAKKKNRPRRSATPR